MTKLRVNIIFVAALVAYVVIAGTQTYSLISRRSVGLIALGFAILLIPIFFIWLLWRELRFASGVSEMADSLAAGCESADGELGQPDPHDWRSWFRLASSFDAEGDRKRSRAAMRHALTLYRADATVDA